ncbi:STAS domain-containing protein [Streptomyces sp. NPDC046985]|uniref:STAS domain-containing protein n=1 Tax=Streptomyces sp. NPDC046985 TaxID=3155377 RepID=UPI0033CFA206
MTDTDRALTITQQDHATGIVVLSVTGELDHHTGPCLEQALLHVAFDARTGVVLDLSGLDYCDSTGLTLIIKAHHRAEAAQCPFVVAGPNGDLTRVFEVTGLDQFLTVRADTGQAVAALGG